MIERYIDYGGEGRREKKGRGSEGKRDRVRERETERRWVGACGRLETLVWFSQTGAERRSTAVFVCVRVYLTLAEPGFSAWQEQENQSDRGTDRQISTANHRQTVGGSSLDVSV